MVEFNTLPLNHDFLQKPVQKDSGIEKPIIPINELGETVVETDPRTGANILQNIEASIRRGASKMQLIWTTPSNNPMGGRPKAYGKNVREAIRELVDINKIDITGSELSTASNTNLSGFDGQRFTINEDKRKRDIQEVKDAIDFAADIAGGGGVGIWSQEFVRNITDSEIINKNRKNRFFDFTEKELDYEDAIKNDPKKAEEIRRKGRVDSVKYLYDRRTGQVLRDIKKSSIIYAPKYMTAKDLRNSKDFKVNVKKWSDKKAKYDPNGDGTIYDDDYLDISGEWLNLNDPEDQLKRIAKWDNKNEKFETEEIRWDGIVKKTEEYNKIHSDNPLKPEEMAFRLQMESQVSQSRGQSLYYSQDYESRLKRLKKLQEHYDDYIKERNLIKNNLDSEAYNKWEEDQKKKLIGKDASNKELMEYGTAEDILKEQLMIANRGLRHVHEASGSADAKARELISMVDNITTLDKLAKENSFDSYAELGVTAWQKTKKLKSINKYKKDLYVGPELGWPTAYGGHPEEFIELIQGARKKMVNELVQKGIDKRDAENAAKNHIKGSFDTSHLAMWYDHFAKESPDESDEHRLKRFNKWYDKMVDRMIDEDVIGNIQVVDSITGQHSHLPPGQGVFPVVDAARKVYDAAKKKGKHIDIISEGHEEEKFGAGRMLTETWKAFGSPISTSYNLPGMQNTFSGVQRAYFGATQPPTYIVGAYVPSNDWKLWSEVPFE